MRVRESLYERNRFVRDREVGADNDELEEAMIVDRRHLRSGRNSELVAVLTVIGPETASTSVLL